MTIDDHLLAEAREVAARTRRTLGDAVDDALRLLLHERVRGKGPLSLPTFGGSGPRAGVDLEDKDAVSALLDDERDARAAG